MGQETPQRLDVRRRKHQASPTESSLPMIATTTVAKAIAAGVAAATGDVTNVTAIETARKRGGESA
jgi:hypothetical protein